MNTFQGDSMAARRAASQMHQQAEVLREKMKKLKSQTEELLTGVDRWEGTGAFLFSLQRDELTTKLDKVATICHQYGAVLFQIADRLYSLEGMRKRLEDVERQLLLMTHVDHYRTPSNAREQAYQSAESSADQQRHDRLTAEASYLRQQIGMYEQRYNKEAEDELSKIRQALPIVGLSTEMTRYWGSYLFDSGHKPVLVDTQFAYGRQGRDRIDYLNETIRMNQTVYDYYKNHPNETGPNGESAEQMMDKAHALMEQGRKQGGTYGVPIIFMHGLFGGTGTFDTMVNRFGGRSMVYTVKDGKVVVTEGENQTGDHPCIQFVFEDGSMSFEDQTAEFTQMMEEVKKEYGTDQVMVVSHSMGGLVTTKYIEDTGGKDVRRFVTLGSPIRGSDDNNDGHTALYHTGGGISVITGIADLFNPALEDLRTDSHAINELYENRGQFSQDTEVFSAIGLAAGNIHGDSIVTPNSARGLKDFADPNQFVSKIYPDSTHGGLHENEQETLDSIHFILYGEKPNGHE